jgi:hypothetical protein
VVNRGHTDSLFKQLSLVKASAITRILYRGPGQARLPFVSVPLRMRGDGAPGGAAVVRQCPHLLAKMRKRLPARHPDRFSLSGLICGRLHSASPTVVNGTCCAGLRFPGRRLRAGRNGHTPQPAPGWRLVVAAGRGTARGPGAWEARSSPARGRRILLHHQTPLDDAPRLSRTHRTIIVIGIKSRTRGKFSTAGGLL